MAALFISLLTLVLLLISAFVVLIVLMQRTSQSGGMGAALGGGAAESAFGAETNNILTKGTIYGIIAFFLVALGLYLIYQSQAGDQLQRRDAAALIPAGEATEESGLSEGESEFPAVETGVDPESAEELAPEGGTVESTTQALEGEAQEGTELLDALSEGETVPAGSPELEVSPESDAESPAPDSN